MVVGAAIVLLVLGGVLTFGIGDRWHLADLTLAGYACLVAGVLLVVVALVLNRRRVGGSGPGDGH